MVWAGILGGRGRTCTSYIPNTVIVRKLEDMPFDMVPVSIKVSALGSLVGHNARV